MRILIISDAWHPQVNGVVRTYEHLMEELQKLGHDVKVIGPSEFKTMPMPSYPEIRLALFPYGKLKHKIEEFNPDKIHISAEGPLGQAGRKYCIKHKIPFSTSYHTHFPDYVAKRVAKHLPFLYKPAHSIAKSIVRDFHSKSKAMMVATQSLEDELKGWGFKNPMHRMIRGAKLEQFYPGENTVYPNLKGPIAVYVGRVAIEKSIEDFLSMDWDGSKVIVGDGPARAELERKYPDAVFVGKKVGEDLAAHYRSADVFVFPSRTDTFGIVLIEALASGIPVAGYPVTGPVDILTEPFLGVMDEDLSTASKKALSCGTKEQRSDFVKENYTWEVAAQQFLNAVTPQ